MPSTLELERRARRLAVLCLQEKSPRRYETDDEYRAAVDAVLAITHEPTGARAEAKGYGVGPGPGELERWLSGRRPKVGEVWTFDYAWMENEPGTPALCYEEYEIGNRPGWQFIFPNGSYCGFEPEAMAVSNARYVVTIPTLREYQFTNVFVLVRDFRAGVFSTAFAIMV